MGAICSDARPSEPTEDVTHKVQADEVPPPPDQPETWKPLKVTVVSARGLRNADWLPGQGVSDPFCVCEIEGKPLSRFLTKEIRNNLTPVWNQESEFADYHIGDNLQFFVWDKDLVKQDDLLGRASLANDKFHPSGFEGELQLEQAGKGVVAFLKVKVDTPTKDDRKDAHQLKKSFTSLKPQKPSGNKNCPRDYLWLQDVLTSLAENTAASLGCKDVATGRASSPVFFVIGGCPNAMCGMQAMMFCADDGGQLNFWWVKPVKGEPTRLERQTLNLNTQGQHKNSPGLSRQFYLVLADLFQQGSIVRGWRFGMEAVQVKSDQRATRAFIERDAEITGGTGGTGRLYIHFLWQENWSSNPFARSKYILGKIVYQKRLGDKEYFFRQYEIHDGAALIADLEEPSADLVLPGDDVKRLWELGT
mmetsp:Transcript_30223/g.86726  ORF Transcript_30223/g.86726 Transcript_30223/m.86726 type:complete len:419 (+) Transcript_30223:92-1348(+)